jgi:DUF1680 family protein
VGNDALGHPAASVAPTTQARTVLRPLPHDAVRLGSEGWLGRWQRLNRTATIPHCLEQLEVAGAIGNLRRVLDPEVGPRRNMLFSDSDLYKTLEAIGWELGDDRHDDADPLAAAFEAITALVAAAQEPDGYINSYWGRDGRPRWSDIRDGHELYCAGHLLQAGVAAARNGDDRLLEVGRAFADLLVERFGAPDAEAVPGHPEVEMALVELWRHTGTAAYLDLARSMIDRRGRRWLGEGRFGAAYYIDHTPIRDQSEVTGHAVRQLYLLCGATDVAIETGDAELLSAVERLWEDAYTKKTYVTGGQGSRHRDESFGDPYELPSDRAYNETCAGIASVMWNWRLLLATGKRRYADEMERALYNAAAVGLSEDGTHFFYSNPLQMRAHHDGSTEDSPSTRLPWYGCACCPPNLARLGASVHHHVATVTSRSLQLQLFTPGRVEADLADGTVVLDVETDYPWHATVSVTVVEAPGSPWELAVRRPGWCARAEMSVPGNPGPAHERDGYLVAERAWQAGDTAVVTLDLEPRWVGAHPAVDATRGCVAVVRGPIVYCLEDHDQESGVDLDDLAVDRSVAPEAHERDGIIVLTGRGTTGAAADWHGTLYGSDPGPAPAGREVRWTAIPYYRWANHGENAMRVWLPVASRASEVAGAPAP